MERVTFNMTGDWLSAAEALLDEHHVVATAADMPPRLKFGANLFQHIQRLADAQVCPIYGSYVKSLADVTRMISLSVPVAGPIDPTLEALTEALRHRYHQSTRRRYIVWHEAHVFAEAQPELFWQTVDVMMGVAAEHEYASEEKLLLTRCVFIGEPSLLDFRGFGGWWPEGQSQPLWQVVSGQAVPPTLGVTLK